jgi:predicted 2-oxoglutarate/Fe(II)-dependent dioxygenase YbiX
MVKQDYLKAAEASLLVEKPIRLARENAHEEAIAPYVVEEVRKFKLPAGMAITYTTGAPLCVTKVTSGVRHAGVFWTSSLVKDVRYRDILSDIRQARRLLPIGTTYNLEEAALNPQFILQGVEHKLIRHFL